MIIWTVTEKLPGGAREMIAFDNEDAAEKQVAYFMSDENWKAYTGGHEWRHEVDADGVEIWTRFERYGRKENDTWGNHVVTMESMSVFSEWQEM